MNHVTHAQVIAVHVFHRIVAMESVTAMNHVETVLWIADHVVYVEMDIVSLVRCMQIVQLTVTLFVGMEHARAQRRAKHVIVIALHAPYQNFAEIHSVTMEKHMPRAQRIVQCRLIRVFKSKGQHVYWIVLCQHRKFVNATMGCIQIHKVKSLYCRVTKRDLEFVQCVVKIIHPCSLEQIVFLPVIIHRLTAFAKRLYIH